MSIFLRWGLPALVSVVGGTLAAVSTTGAAIPSDLARRTGDIITASDAAWATIAFDSRDAIVAGTAPDAASRDDLVRRVAAVHGVRAVVDNAAIAETAEVAEVAMRPEDGEGEQPVSTVAPWLEARVVDGAVILDGAVPQSDLLNLLAGIPDASGVDVTEAEAPPSFAAGIGMVQQAAEKLDEGKVLLRDGTITATGRARTSDDYVFFARDFAGLVDGMELGQVEVDPPATESYTFAIEKPYTGGAFVASGNLPTLAVRDRLFAELGGDVEDETTFADGAPDDFQSSAVKGIEILATLNAGRVRFDGSNWALDGQAASHSDAVAAQAAFAVSGLDVAGWSYEVDEPAIAEPVLVEPFTLEVRKAADGSFDIAGYFPSEESRTTLVSRLGADATDGSVLAKGAPAGFESAASVGIGALLKLDQGTLSLSGSDWSLSGDVDTTAERYAVEAGLRRVADRDAWRVAIQAADAAPVVSPFNWRADKSSDGRISIAGYVPTSELRSALGAAAGGTATDRSLVASGEPEGFGNMATSGLELLAVLSEGRVAWDEGGWLISGRPVSADADAAIRSALADGWTIDLLPPPVEAAVPPETPAAPSLETEPPLKTAAVEPQPSVPQEPAQVLDMTGRDFRFHVDKSLDGVTAVTGAVPSEMAAAQLTALASLEDATLGVDPALPATFVSTAEAGLRALARLADGEFGLEGDNWLFSGRAETAAGRAAALAALAAAPAGQQWTTDVTILPPLDLCRAHISRLASRNAILFQSGSALIAEDSQPVIDELVAYLAECPEASIEVEGHTDADGEDDVNLALSVARAESVVDALVLRGVAPDRLYAVGYGESLPVASNETRAGKQANRRIAFNVSEN